MPYQPTTNFRDSNGVDLGKKLVTKDYLLEVYGSILESLGNSGLTVSPALWGWGTNVYTQLGTSGGARNTPITTSSGGTNWKQISVGREHSGAVKTDGTLWMWGTGTNGRTARGNDGVVGPNTTFAGGTNWKSVSCGRQHTAAIKTDGTLWVWGAEAGFLGINAAGDRTFPVTTFAGGTNWKSVFAGFNHTAAIKTDGTLWLWGNNNAGQLGTNDNGTNRGTPVTTFAGGTNWKQVSSQGYNVSAIKTDGTLWVWGFNSNSELGINNTSIRSAPVTTFAGGTTWKSVNGSIAIKTDGTLWVWGANGGGQLGINIAGATNGRSTPVTTFAGGTNWKSVYSGYTTGVTSAIKTDGTLWTWGNGGILGTNDANRRSTPVTTFLGGNDWKSVSTGLSDTSAIRSNDYI